MKLKDILHGRLYETLTPSDTKYGHLKKWNQEQRMLWTRLVAKGAVPGHPKSNEDLKLFMKFAKFFSDYFEEYKRSPNITAIAKHLDVTI